MEWRNAGLDLGKIAMLHNPSQNYVTALITIVMAKLMKGAVVFWELQDCVTVIF
jgi:hypothetical protein